MDCSSDFHFTVFMIYVFSLSEPVGGRKLKRDKYTWYTAPFNSMQTLKFWSNSCTKIAILAVINSNNNYYKNYYYCETLSI